VHRALFRFLPRHFADVAKLPSQLALAARTSASFPGAFEPSFVPIGAADASRDRPDMQDIASFTTSRWVLDGGVLMNKPVEPALLAVEKRVGSGDERRVLAYVNPDPGSPDIELDFGDDAPTIGKVVLSSLVTMPRAESIADDLATIARYNQSLSGQTHGRDRLLWGDWIHPDDATPLREARSDPAEVRARLIESGAVIYPFWVRRRHTDAVRTRLENHLSASKQHYDITTTRTLDGGGFTYVELRAAMEEQRRLMRWLPADLPTTDELAASSTWRLGFTPLEYLGGFALDLVRRLYAMLPADSSATPAWRDTLATVRLGVHRERAWLRALRHVDDDYYRYGLDNLDPRRCATDLAAALYGQWPKPPADLLALASSSAPIPAANAERMADWQRVQLLLGGLDVTLDQGKGWPEDPALLHDVQLSADLGAGARSLDDVMREAELRIARRLAGHLLALGPVLSGVVAEYRNRFTAPTRSAVAPDCDAPPELWEPDVMEQTADVIGLPHEVAQPATTGDPEAALLEVVTSLYIVHASTQPDVGQRSTSIEFAQLSAAVPSQLDPSRERPADKVAGLQVAHFGAFLKESWRANDWMWGCLDAADRLVRLVLEPARLQQMYASQAQGVARVQQLFFGAATTTGIITPAESQGLALEWHARFEADVTAELRFLDRQSGVPLPMSLPNTAAAIAYVLQLTIGQRELPEVAAAIERSAAAGADESPAAAEFVKQIDTIRSGKAARIPLTDVASLTRACRVGQERVSDELGSDAGAATVTKVAAVAATAASGSRSGLGPLRHGVKVLRTGLIAAYVTATAAARRSKIGFALITLLLAVGAGAIAARLIGGRVPNTVLVVACFALGFWILLTGFTARAWSYSATGVIALAAVGLSFVDTAAVCPAIATRCAAGIAQPGWKGTAHWLAPLVLGALAVVSAVVAWRRLSDLREQQARRYYSAKVREHDQKKRGVTPVTAAGTTREPIRRWPYWPVLISIVTTAGLAALAVGYRFAGHDWMFRGDGTRGGRAWVVHQLEGWSRANVLVVLIGLPLVFILLGWVRQSHRDARLARRHSLAYRARADALRED
jgi:patatin-related protein